MLVMVFTIFPFYCSHSVLLARPSTFFLRLRPALLTGLVPIFHRRLVPAALPHSKQFPFMCSQKRFSPASLLISAKYFQNRLIMFSLELQCYMQQFSCQHRKHHISKRNYEIFSSTGDSYFHIRTTKMVA